MKPPFHIRGPFMAKIWLLVALTIIGIQMIFVVNLLSSKNDPAAEEEVFDIGDHPAESPVAGKLDQLAADAVDAENEVNVHSHTEHDYPKETLKIPDIKVKEPPKNDILGSLGQLMGGNFNTGPISGGFGGNSEIFNILQQAVMQQFTREFDVPNSNLEGMERASESGKSKVSQLIPLLTMLPMLLGTPSKTGTAEINWEKYMPLLERMEKFSHFCTRTFHATIVEMKKKYPEKTSQPSFGSAVAMKGFFRIFANEDQQDGFLEMADEAFDLLDVLGLTDHVIDLMSGRLYDQMTSGTDSEVGGKFDLSAILLPPGKKPTTTPKSNNGDDESEEDEEDEAKSSFVSNEHFESIMEMYDAMFRDDESSNQTVAKMELNGRSFLQTWYESMRRYAREKGKIQAKAYSPAEFDKFMEAIEVPYSNIMDFYYPIKNEQLCATSQLDLLAVVVSKTQHLPLRNSIRQTWARDLPANVKLVFLLSDRDEDRDAVKLESEKYGDIITVDVPQTYEYVTRKALVSLDWPSRFCSSAKYILKTTDRSYANLTFILEELGRPLIGNLIENEKVQRVPLKLNHLFYDEYPFDIFSPYLKDFGFVMNMDFAKNGVTAAKDFPLIRTDDFAVTGIIAAKLKVVPGAFTHHPFTNLLDIPWEDSRKSGAFICEHKSSAVFTGKITAAQMLFIQGTLNTCST